MIKNNYFYINNLKNVIFLGVLNDEKKFIEINKKFSINTEIITSPDQKKAFSKNTNIKVFDKIDDKFINYIKNKYNIEQTLFLAISCRWIFSKKIIKFLKNNLVNSHPTRLPIDAGSGGFSYQIMRGDTICNQLFHLVDKKIDNGPIIYNQLSLFPSNAKIPLDYYEHHYLELLKFYESFIYQIVNKKKFIIRNQIKYLSTYNPRLLTKLHGWIDWNLDVLNLDKFISAFDDPYQGSCTFLGKTKVFIKKSRIHGGEINCHPFMSGIVLRNDENWIVVSTKQDQYKFIIEEVFDSKGKNITSKIKPGDRFHTPITFLDKGKSKRVIFNSKGLKK